MYTLKHIKYKNILHIEDLTIPALKTTCILGESGSGKTTLMRLLNQMISCDEGSILYKGQPLDEINSISLRRNVVMLSQAPAIFEGSVKDNLLLGLSFSEKPPVGEEALTYVLEITQLKIDLNRNAEQLSGGEKQRLALARVLLMMPEVLLLDEPSASLDKGTESFVMDQLVQYTKQKGITLIIVTHSKEIAEQYAEFTITIQQGKVISTKEMI